MENILLIDDEEKFISLYDRVLSCEGFAVTSTNNAWWGYEILKRKKFDLVLLDLRMPDIDGVELYGVLKLFFSEIRVIVISVIPVENQKKMIPDACDYFDKGMGMDVLVDKVKKALRPQMIARGVPC